MLPFAISVQRYQSKSEPQPCIYSWPEFCSGCGTALGIWQIPCEIKAQTDKVDVASIAFQFFPRICCRRFIIAPIQNNFHTMDLNVFSMNHEIPTRSAIHIYSDDSNITNFDSLYKESSNLVEGFVSSFFDTLPTLRAEEVEPPRRIHQDIPVVQAKPVVRNIKRTTFRK